MSIPSRRRITLAVLASLIALVLGFTAAAPAGAAPLFTLSISSSSLILPRGSASISIGSTAASVSWKVTDPSGALVANGVRWMSAGAAVIDLSTLTPGYYTLALHAGAAPNATDLSSSFAVIEPVPATVDSPFGVATHLNRPGWGIDVLDDADAIGITNIREDAPWNKIETSPGVYSYPSSLTAIVDGARARGIEPMLIANGTSSFYDSGRTPSTVAGISAYAAFAADLVARYDLKSIEIYNEYNGSTFNNSLCGRTAACYLDVLDDATAAIHAARPSTSVVGPSTIGIGNCFAADGTPCFAPALVAAGGLTHLDAYSVHPYRYPGGPEWLGGSGDSIAGLRTLLRSANSGADFPIILSEMGWPTHDGGGTSEAQQADNLVRLYAVALANGVGRVYWYDLVNDGTGATNAEHNFGMLRQPVVSTSATLTSVAAHAPKPAAVAQAVIARMLSGREYAGSDVTVLPLRSVRFGSGVQETRILWSTTAVSATVSATGPITITDVRGGTTVIAPVAGVVTLPVSASPLFITGPVSAVS